MSEAVQLINLFDAGVQNTGDAAFSAQTGASSIAEGQEEALFSELVAASGLIDGDIPLPAGPGAANPGANDNLTVEAAVLSAALAALDDASAGEDAAIDAQALEKTASTLLNSVLEKEGAAAGSEEEEHPGSAGLDRALQRVAETPPPAAATGGLPGPADTGPVSDGDADAKTDVVADAETALETQLTANAPASAPGEVAIASDGQDLSAAEREAEAGEQGNLTTRLAALHAAAMAESEQAAQSAQAAIAGPGQSLGQAEAAASAAPAASAVPGSQRTPGRPGAAGSGAIGSGATGSGATGSGATGGGAPAGGGEPGAGVSEDGVEFAASAKPNGEAAKAATGNGDGDKPSAARQNFLNPQPTNSAHAPPEISGRTPGELIGERSGSSSALFQTTSETPVFASPPETVRSVVRAALQANNLVALPVRTIAVHIANRLVEGQRAFQIRLDPPELGRIDIRMEIARDGHLTAQLTADRPEAFDALSRDARALERALQAAGLELEEGALEFHLREQGADDHSGDEDTASRDGSDTAGDEDEPVTTRRVSLNALDISV